MTVIVLISLLYLLFGNTHAQVDCLSNIHRWGHILPKYCYYTFDKYTNFLNVLHCCWYSYLPLARNSVYHRNYIHALFLRIYDVTLISDIINITAYYVYWLNITPILKCIRPYWYAVDWKVVYVNILFNLGIYFN